MRRIGTLLQIHLLLARSAHSALICRHALIHEYSGSSSIFMTALAVDHSICFMIFVIKTRLKVVFVCPSEIIVALFALHYSGIVFVLV